MINFSIGFGQSVIDLDVLGFFFAKFGVPLSPQDGGQRVKNRDLGYRFGARLIVAFANAAIASDVDAFNCNGLNGSLNG